MYFNIVTSGLGILLFFRVLNLINRKFPYQKKVKLLTSYLLSVVELFIWIGFLIWSVRFLYESYDYTALLILAVLITLIIIPLWYVIRDFLYGVVLKIQRKIDIGYILEFDEMTGVVVKIGHLSFDIKLKNGNINSIPYNKVISKVISKHSLNINIDSYQIIFKINSHQSLNSIIQQLKLCLINAPWSVSTHEAIINEVKSEDGEFLFDVNVYVLSKDHADKIKEYVLHNVKA